MDMILCLCVLVLSLTFESGYSDHLGHIDSPDELLWKHTKGETISNRVHLPVTASQPKVTDQVNDKLIPHQVISQPSLQLTNSYGVGGGPPAYKRFRRQSQTTSLLKSQFSGNKNFDDTLEEILQRFDTGDSDKLIRSQVTSTRKVTSSISDGTGNPGFKSIKDDFPNVDALFERFRNFGFTDNSKPSAPLVADDSKSPAVKEQPTTARPAPEIRISGHVVLNTPISPITTDECGVVPRDEIVPLIHNGHLYERGELPWLVAMYRIVQKNLLFICGGTLVTNRHVASAAHCMSRPSVQTPITEIVIKIGLHRLNDWDDDYTVTRKLLAATIHEEFNPATLINDIMILTLNKRVQFNRYIRPACLWSGDTELSLVVGATGVVAGWGDRGTGGIGTPDEPQMVRVPIVSTKECRASHTIFHKLTYNSTLCAGDRNGAGPCNGDSGGGLYLREGGKWRLRGIVSVSPKSETGAHICNLNEYIVYSDTAQFLPWIRNILSEKYYD